MKRVLYPVWVVVLLVGFSSAHGQTDHVVYVRTPNTALHEAPMGTAAIKSRLKTGTVLTVVSTRDRWIEVTCDAGQGFVFGAKTASEPPSVTDPLWDDELGDTTVASPEATTARGIRGLSRSATAHVERNEEVTPEHVQQLERLENVRISDEELDRFLEQGRLAEYVQ